MDMLKMLSIVSACIFLVLLGYFLGLSRGFYQGALSIEACECTEDDIIGLTYKMNVLDAKQDSLVLLAVDDGCGSR